MESPILFDKHEMIGSILNLPKQIQYGIRDDQFLKFSKKKLHFKNIIVVGIGSSLIAYKIIQSLYSREFKIPIYCLNEVRLPSWVDHKTLIILSSFSGNTREVISLARQALAKNLIIFAITSGGKLIDILKDQAEFIYFINKELFNPCKQPRMAIGYFFAAFFRILTMLNIIEIKDKKIFSNLDFKFDKEVLFKKMRMVSSELNNKLIDIVSCGFLSGSAELFFKQLNWNSKQQASYHLAPEAMHYLVEGLKCPKKYQKERTFIILTSDYISKEDKDDLFILRKYLTKLNYNVINICMQEKTKLSQVIEAMVKTSLISYFLALLNREDPTPTSGIDYYKLNLK